MGLYDKQVESAPNSDTYQRINGVSKEDMSEEIADAYKEYIKTGDKDSLMQTIKDVANDNHANDNAYDINNLQYADRKLELAGSEYGKADGIAGQLAYNTYLYENGIKRSSYDEVYSAAEDASSASDIQTAIHNENPAIPRGDGWYALAYSADGSNTVDSARITASEYKIDYSGMFPSAYMRSAEPNDYLGSSGAPKDMNDYASWETKYFHGDVPSDFDEKSLYPQYAEEAARNGRAIQIDMDEPTQMNPQLLQGIQDYENPGIARIHPRTAYEAEYPDQMHKNDLSYDTQSGKEAIDMAVETGNPAVDKGDGWYSLVYTNSDSHNPKDAYLDTAEYQISDETGGMVMRSSHADDYLQYEGGELVAKDTNSYASWRRDVLTNSVSDGMKGDVPDTSVETYAKEAAASKEIINVNMMDASQVPSQLVDGMRNHQAANRTAEAIPAGTMSKESQAGMPMMAAAGQEIMQMLKQLVQSMEKYFGNVGAESPGKTATNEYQAADVQREGVDMSTLDTSKAIQQENGYMIA